MSSYESTSERLCEESDTGTAGDYLLFLFHLATYEFARPFIEDRTVLDFGCGTGYGTRTLADTARHITGVDIAEDAILLASEKYRRADVASRLLYDSIQPVEVSPLPFEDHSFDTVVSFQVIEHVPSVPSYLAEIRRVMRPGGTFLCATPDRRWRLFPRQRPFNQFHVDEWNPEQFVRMLSPVFPNTLVYGMSASPEILRMELHRCRQLRLAALPFTFPGAPERWRTFGLHALKSIASIRKPAAHSESAVATDYDFGLEDIVVALDARPSVNMIAVCSG